MDREFPSNSRIARPEPETEKPETKKVTRVVSGEVVRRKKPLGKRLTETLFGGDVHSVWGYVVFDVLIPAGKDMVADAVTGGVERMVFGEARGGSRRPSYRPTGGGYTPYNRYSPTPRENRPSNPPGRDISRRSRAAHDFDEIILESRVEAEEVLSRLAFYLDKYEAVAVSDLYELVGISANFTDEKWGWTDLSHAGVSRVSRGYLLNLPRPEQI